MASSTQYDNLLASFRVIEAIGSLIAKQVPLPTLFADSAQIIVAHLDLALVCWWHQTEEGPQLLACAGDTSRGPDAQALAHAALREGHPGICCASEGDSGVRIVIALEGNPAVRHILTLTNHGVMAMTPDQFDMLATLAVSLAYYINGHEREQALTTLSHCDALTGLPNRARFMQLLCQLCHVPEGTQPLYPCIGVGILDLDHFKEINDTLGHQAGDTLLTEMGHRFTAALGDLGVVARLGGDEFGILLTSGCAEVTLAATCAKLLESTKAGLIINDVEMQVNASLGVTICPLPPGATAAELLRQADVALYAAKRSGKNTWRSFCAELDKSNLSRHEIRQSFQHALDAGDLVVHYQPIVSLHTYAVTGVEALVRWPARGTSGVPNTFLPIVESDSTLIRALGRYVLAIAMEDLASWHATGRQLRLSVNIGARHLLHPEFIADLTEAVKRHPALATWLTLEITESAALADLDNTTRVMESGANLGVTWAIDDFGTGHASMQYLQKLPASTIKLDHSFVKGMLSKIGDFAVVSGVLLAAKLKGLTVVAEGVESAELGKMLLRLGCDATQGFWFSRALPATELDSWITHWTIPEEWHQITRVAFLLSDMDLLMASTVHREGIHGVIDAIQHAANTKTPFLSISACADGAPCRFGRWLANEGARYAPFPEFTQVVAAHTRVHAIISDILIKHAADSDIASIEASVAVLLAAAAHLDTAIHFLILAVESAKISEHPAHARVQRSLPGLRTQDGTYADR